jgi:hypothetical protein
LEIAVLARVLVVLVGSYFATVAEIMAFVNYDKVVVAPVDMLEVEAFARTVAKGLCDKEYRNASGRQQVDC